MSWTSKWRCRWCGLPPRVRRRKPHEKVVHVSPDQALFELDGLRANLHPTGLDLGFERVDRGTMAARLRTFLLSPARSTSEHAHDHHCTPPPLCLRVAGAPSRSQDLRFSRRPPGSARDAAVSALVDRDERPSKMCGAARSTRTLTKVPGDVLVLWRGEVYELSLAGAAAQHLRSFLEDLDDRSLDEADAAHVACERGPLDHDLSRSNDRR